jgi:hypothetical protein
MPTSSLAVARSVASATRSRGVAKLIFERSTMAGPEILRRLRLSTSSGAAPANARRLKAVALSVPSTGCLLAPRLSRARGRQALPRFRVCLLVQVDHKGSCPIAR